MFITLSATYCEIVALKLSLYLKPNNFIKLTVRIHTDASHSKRYNVGTYAFWIECEVGIFFRSGKYDGGCFSSINSEMKAIIKALHFVLSCKDINATKIICNTDCLFGATHLSENFTKVNEKTKKTDKKILDEFDQIRKLYTKIYEPKLKTKKISIQFSHVKSHQKGVLSQNQFINNFCDKQAKIQMGQMIKKLKK